MYECQIAVCQLYFVIVFHRDNLEAQESADQRVLRDKEERPDTWGELDQLAKGLISYFTHTSHMIHIPHYTA